MPSMCFPSIQVDHLGRNPAVVRRTTYDNYGRRITTTSTAPTYYTSSSNYPRGEKYYYPRSRSRSSSSSNSSDSDYYSDHGHSTYAPSHSRHSSYTGGRHLRDRLEIEAAPVVVTNGVVGTRRLREREVIYDDGLGLRSSLPRGVTVGVVPPRNRVRYTSDVELIGRRPRW